MTCYVNTTNKVTNTANVLFSAALAENLMFKKEVIMWHKELQTRRSVKNGIYSLSTLYVTNTVLGSSKSYFWLTIIVII